MNDAARRTDAYREMSELLVSGSELPHIVRRAAGLARELVQADGATVTRLEGDR